jgi:hypothetical protein
LQKSALDSRRAYFTHNQVVKVFNRKWEGELALESDVKQTKFCTRESSLLLKLGPQASKWRLKLEASRRKNAFEHFASREYLRDETMPTYKHSVGLQFGNMTGERYQKAEVEVGLPISANSCAFARADFFVAQKHELSEVCNLIWQAQGGVVRPLFGAKTTAINDRFFITNPMGYRHIGQTFAPNIPPSA